MTVRPFELGQSRGGALLAVPPVDADGRLLTLRTVATDHVAVADLTVELPGVTILLEVLAASHRIRLRATGADRWDVHETVACSGSGPAGALPRRRSWTAGGWRIDFRSALAVGRGQLDRALATVADLNADVAVRPRLLVARFPGHEDAVTALVVDEPAPTPTPIPAPTPMPAARWRTWHLYPGTDPHLVATATSVRRSEEIDR